MTDPNGTEEYDELLARYIAERMFEELRSRSPKEVIASLRAIAERHKQRLTAQAEKEAAAIARLEEEGYRVVPLSGGGYVVVDIACPPCSTECSSLDELLDYCAEVLEHLPQANAP